MRIIEKEKTDNCFNESFEYRYRFDCVFTKDNIQMLSCLGDLRYYDTFPIPMFCVNNLHGQIIKGVEGSNECRIIYNRNTINTDMDIFERHFEQIPN